MGFSAGQVDMLHTPMTDMPGGMGSWTGKGSGSHQPASHTPAHHRAGPAAREEPATFAEQVRDATRRVRTALAEALASVNADPARPQGVARRLGLDKNLAWKAARIVTDDDLLTAVGRLPGKPGAKILIEALEKSRASESAVGSLRESLADFDRLVETHAGDRETLQKMLTGESRESRAARDEQNRKLSFQGNSGTWGVQARVQFGMHFVAPTTIRGSEHMLDLATVSGLIDFRRLRPDVAWGISMLRQFRDDGTIPKEMRIEPVDPTEAADWNPQMPPMMRSFCSSPLPQMRAVPTRSGVLRYELVEGPVGNTAAMTVLTGWFRRAAVDRYRTKQDWSGEHMVTLSTPAEELVHDLYMHRDLHFAMPPRAVMHSQLPGQPMYPESPRDHGLLPLAHDIVSLDELLASERVPTEVPRMSEMLAMTAARLGWSMDDFEGYRLRLRYPPMPALSVIRYPLPERE